MASILVIEEQSGTHEMLKSALVIAGHDVVVSNTPYPGGRYDLALVDCSKESVTTVVQAAGEVTRRVALYSDCPEEQLKEKAKEAGAVGYVLRSASPKAMLEEVHRLLKA